jgi:hypothetical protein
MRPKNTTKRLERNENAVNNTFFILSTTTYPLFWQFRFNFKDKIHELAHIHIEINIYSLEGKLLKSSKNLFQ